MTTLVDWQIQDHLDAGTLVISPLLSPVKATDVDLHLDGVFTNVYTESDAIPLDGSIPLLHETHERDVHILAAGHSILARTIERLTLPPDVIGRVIGRSSVARVHTSIQNADRVKAGFEGIVVLEISNHGQQPVQLQRGMAICAIEFEQVAMPRKTDIGRFHGQTDVRTIL